MHSVSFPGLGIQEFSINSVAFSIGKLSVRWYGLIITFGIVLAVLYVALRMRERGIGFDHVMDLTLFTVVSGVIGARLFYVLTSLDNPTYHDIRNWFAIWNGGLAIYGGILGGGLAVLLVTRHKKISFPLAGDCIIPAVLIGQILGRWGNFFNCEAHGGETTLPWRMGIWEGGQQIFVHPTFLYESLWNLIGFLLINFLYRKKKYDGEVTLFAFAWYGFGRMWIELLRTDSLYLLPYVDANGNHPWFLKISVLIGLLFFVGCTALLVIHRIQHTDFFFHKIEQGKMPADSFQSDALTQKGILAFKIGVPVLECGLILFVILASVIQNL